VLTSVRPSVDPRARVQLDGLCQGNISVLNHGQTHNLAVCSTVPQPTMPPHDPVLRGLTPKKQD